MCAVSFFKMVCGILMIANLGSTLELTSCAASDAMDVEADVVNLIQMQLKMQQRRGSQDGGKVNATWAVPNHGGLEPMFKVFASLPPSSMNVPKKEKARPVRVAVCAVGHIRSFVYPGVYTSWIPYLFQSQEDSTEVELFFEGHLGNYSGNFSGQSYKYVGANTDFLVKHGYGSEREAANDALVLFNKSHIHIDSGGCADLQKFWRAKGITRKCRGDDVNFMQVMFVDMCIQRVKEQGGFDYVVRTRPDIALFNRVDITKLPRDKISFMWKEGHWYSDFFFVMPTSFILQSYWSQVVEMYDNGGSRLSDSKDLHFFDQSVISSKNLSETAFPAVIVRDLDDADCFRLAQKAEDRLACGRKAKAGEFGEFDHRRGRHI